jgi:hypothetical protein
MNLGKIIDWIGKNLGRIKTVGLVVIILLFVVSISRSGCDRAEMESMIQRITGLNVQNDILNNDIVVRDSLLHSKEQRILDLEDSLILSDVRFNDLEVDKGTLEDELRHLSDSLLQVPVDTSYSYLTQEAYPYRGVKEYPFNEPQVRGIHLTFLEHLKLQDISAVMEDQIDELLLKAHMQDTIAIENKVAMALMIENRQDLEQIIDNKDGVIEEKDKVIKKVKSRKTLWQIIAGSILVVFTAIAAGGG